MNARNDHPILFIILLLWMLFPTTNLKAQDLNIGRSGHRFTHKLFNPNLLLEFRPYIGFIAPHKIELDAITGHFSSFELNLSRVTYGRQLWQQMYAYPRLGVALWYTNFGNNPILGQAYACFPYINYPLLRAPVSTINFRLGIGLAYLTNSFDPIDNYKNLAIGSQINVAVNLLLDYRYQINENLYASLSVGLVHFSNGSIKLPNYGLNIPVISTGLSHRLQHKNKTIKRRLYTPPHPYRYDIHRLMETNIGCAIGFKDMENILGERFTVYAIWADLLKRISYKSKIGLGFDYSYDPSHKALLKRTNGRSEKKHRIAKPGINLAYELSMSKVSYLFNLGLYLGGDYTSNGNLYQKLALQYLISPHLFTTISLRTHYGRADYIGWGLGYKLNWEY